MNDAQKTDRAERAKRLLDDPMLLEGFEAVRTAIVQRWEQAPIRDKDGAHELKLMLKLLGDVRAALVEAVNDGKVVTFNAKQRLMDRIRDSIYK